MRKTKLRKHTKNPTKRLEEKLDKEYQDFFREVCWEFGIVSEYSGKRMEVCHHHIEKSRCATLRYNPINFIPLTTGEHTEHTLSKGNGRIINRVIFKRGQGWIKKIEQLAHKTISKNSDYYKKAQEQLEYMRLHKKELAETYFKKGYFDIQRSF